MGDESETVKGVLKSSENSEKAGRKGEVCPNWPFPLRIYGAVVYYVALLIFALGGLLFSVAGSSLRLVIPEDRAEKFGRRSMSWIFRWFAWFLRATRVVQVDCAELDRLRKKSGILIAPNHPSLIDAVFIISRYPDVVCIMKSGILRNPVLAGGSRFAGFVSNDPPVTMVRESIRALRAGCKLLVFPEGTRTVRSPINPFQRSFAIIGRAADAPVQMVLVESNSPCLGKGWPIFQVPQFPIHYRFSLGDEVRVPIRGDLKPWVLELEGIYRDRLAGKVVVPGDAND